MRAGRRHGQLSVRVDDRSDDGACGQQDGGQRRDGASKAQIRVRATVSGMVQGVGFRYCTVLQARDLGLTGWVRNMRDGSVQVEAQGPRIAVASLVSWLKRGPQWAQVERCDVEEIALDAAASSSFGSADAHSFVVLYDRDGV